MTACLMTGVEHGSPSACLLNNVVQAVQEGNLVSCMALPSLLHGVAFIPTLEARGKLCVAHTHQLGMLLSEF